VEAWIEYAAWMQTVPDGSQDSAITEASRVIGDLD
jgi:hypothetical protein